MCLKLALLRILQFCLIRTYPVLLARWFFRADPFCFPAVMHLKRLLEVAILLESAGALRYGAISVSRA